MVFLIFIFCLNLLAPHARAGLPEISQNLLTRSGWSAKLATASPTWPPSTMTDDELRVWADALLESGNSYGEYLNLRLHARALGNTARARTLNAAAESLFEQDWMKWIPESLVPEITRYTVGSQDVIRDDRGLIRGAKGSIKRFRAIIEKSGGAAKLQVQYVEYGYDGLGVMGLEMANWEPEDTASLSKLKIKDLSLSRLFIRPALAKVLSQSKALKALSIEFSQIDDSAARALFERSTFEKLTLRECGLHEQALRIALDNKNITHLRFNGDDLVTPNCQAPLLRK